MLKLMRADFARLIKSRSYWICVILSSAVCILNIVTGYIASKNSIQSIATYLMGDSSNNMLFTAIFVSLFIGTDHACGTIRNKLIVGHSREEVYFSNLAVTCSAALGMRVISWICVLIFGFAAGGKIGMDAGELMLNIAIIVMLLFAACAIFTFIGMMISSKSTNTVISIVSVIALIVGCALIKQFLDQPDMIYDVAITDNGIMPLEPYPNPMYVSGTARDLLTTLLDILPGGQAIQLEMRSLHTPELMPLYSLGVIIVVTAAGLILFRKKDLK